MGGQSHNINYPVKQFPFQSLILVLLLEVDRAVCAGEGSGHLQPFFHGIDSCNGFGAQVAHIFHGGKSHGTCPINQHILILRAEVFSGAETLVQRQQHTGVNCVEIIRNLTAWDLILKRTWGEAILPHGLLILYNAIVGHGPPRWLHSDPLFCGRGD